MIVPVVFAVALAGIPLAQADIFAQLFTGGGPAAVLAKIVVAIVALGVLIFIHELGHFLVAKAVGVGVERFSLGFGPRIWSYRGKETEYCVSVVPLGGYVKMVGEEAHGEDVIHPPTPAPQDFRTDPTRSFALRPLSTRALIVFAGPGMNFVLAAFIFFLVFATVGFPVPSRTVGRIAPDSPAAETGLRLGDEVVAVDGQPVRHWGQIEEQVARSGGRRLTLTVVRDGTRREVAVTPRRVPSRTPFGEPTEVWSVGATAYVPPVVGEVVAGRPAAEAGLQPGDRIVALDGRPVQTWDELAEMIWKRPGEQVALTIERGTERFEKTVFVRPETDRDPFGKETKVGRIGIAPRPGAVLRHDPLSALLKGVERTWEVTVLTVVSIWKLVTGIIPVSNIGGPLQIGMVTGQAAQQGFIQYVSLVAILSVNLAVLNLLPVPMLDGGHLLFFAIEAVLGRPLSVRKREIAQQIGLALLLLLMVFAIGNDILRLPFVDRLFK